MPDAFALIAQAPDVTAAVGGPALVTAIGGLGIGGALIYTFVLFMNDRKDRDREMREFMTSQQKFVTDLASKFETQLDKMDDRREKTQREFQDQIRDMTGKQNGVLSDMTSAFKMMERTVNILEGSFNAFKQEVAVLESAVAGKRLKDDRTKPQA